MNTVQSQHLRFNLIPQETLLEGLERTGHEIEYQCRSGFCGACRVRMLAGEVQYLEQPLAFIAADEILPCCCIPTSDIRIECELRPELLDTSAQDDMFQAQQSLFDILPPEPGKKKKAPRKKRIKSTVLANNLSLF
ncbi:ferredoxin [Methylophilus rhizosphaerae]|uniref:Ferredoxin n=1 Tax=Methylophilus rhizosphaerae TaxID=492660 RepID=A0A1G9BPD2_9PROT|nr:class I ribonucleotide reductase maintenance protein YfaE [Methylophilus rhizosphaerae]SDK40735.1 ferredoxin [Methylophilus rhizosphaerae]